MRRGVHDYEYSVKSMQGRVEKVQSMILKLSESMTEKRNSIWEQTSELRERVEALPTRQQTIESLTKQLRDTRQRCEELSTKMRHLRPFVQNIRDEVARLNKVEVLVSERRELQEAISTLTLAPECMVALQSGYSNIDSLPQLAPGSMNRVCSKLIMARNKYISLLKQISSFSDSIKCKEEGNMRESLRQIQEEMVLQSELIQCDILELNEYRMEVLIEAKQQNIQLLKQRKDREAIQLLNARMEYDNGSDQKLKQRLLASE